MQKREYMPKERSDHLFITKENHKQLFTGIIQIISMYRLTLPSIRSCVPMLTTVHPIAFAELRQRVWFSFLSQGFKTRFVLIALSSIVPGTATLINLLSKRKTKTSSIGILSPCMSFDFENNTKQFSHLY